jgi:hypothetical protein
LLEKKENPTRETNDKKTESNLHSSHSTMVLTRLQELLVQDCGQACNKLAGMMALGATSGHPFLFFLKGLLTREDSKSVLRLICFVMMDTAVEMEFPVSPTAVELERNTLLELIHRDNYLASMQNFFPPFFLGRFNMFERQDRVPSLGIQLEIVNKCVECYQGECQCPDVESTDDLCMNCTNMRYVLLRLGFTVRDTDVGHHSKWVGLCVVNNAAGNTGPEMMDREGQVTVWFHGRFHG